MNTNERWTPRVWGTLIVLCAALFMDGLDLSMVGVTLPSIGHDLGMSTSALQWVVSGYVLGYGGLLLLGGRAADLMGRREVFLVALGVFAAASLFGGLVDSGGLVIASRFIKGASAAFTAPAALSLIVTTFPEGPQRNKALGIFSATAASGFSLGLVISGLLTEIGWRWAFLLPFPIATIALFAGIRLIPHQPAPPRAERRYDSAGAIVGTGSLSLLVYTVTQAADAGWGSARTIGSLAGVVVMAVAFLIIESRSAAPLVRLGIFTNGNVSRANIGALLFFGAYTGFQFVLTLYLQDLLGWSALTVAMALLPSSLMVILGSTQMPRLFARFGPAKIMAGGFIAYVAGYALLLRIGLQTSYAPVLLPSVVLVGIGFVLCFSSSTVAGTMNVRDEEQGLASGLVQTSLQIGGAIVLAVVTAVVTSGSHGAADAHGQLEGYRTGIAVVVGVALLGFVISLFGVITEQRSRIAPHPESADAASLPVG
ncbi:MFS transporter [Actinacidiphila sp. bgisy167]|uniref:MFS transporter n=1 Tax=Actinacidiphila sp. bgisy167 TaxID=3413797 RepID=UPI003D75C3B2